MTAANRYQIVSIGFDFTDADENDHPIVRFGLIEWRRMVVRQLEVIAFASSHLTFVCDAFVP
jgi:hypothetical protein